MCCLCCLNKIKNIEMTIYDWWICWAAHFFQKITAQQLYLALLHLHMINRSVLLFAYEFFIHYDFVITLISYLLFCLKFEIPFHFQTNFNIIPDHLSELIVFAIKFLLIFHFGYSLTWIKWILITNNHFNIITWILKYSFYDNLANNN